jgi:hypothetical protein
VRACSHAFAAEQARMQQQTLTSHCRPSCRRCPVAWHRSCRVPPTAFRAVWRLNGETSRKTAEQQGYQEE